MSTFDTARKAELLSLLDTLGSVIGDTDTIENLLAQITALTAERDAAFTAQQAIQAKLDAVAAKLNEADAADAIEDQKRADIHAIIAG